MYRHYKGNEYVVLGIGLHTETGETLVIYRREHDDTIWVRPMSMFLEKVLHNGNTVDRFALIRRD